MPIENHNKMGLWGAVSFVCGNIIGSGLFISPSSILRKTQSVGLALSIWGFSAVISVIGAYCYVELGTSIRRSGADFAYLCYVGWFPAAFAFMSTGCLMTYPATLAVQAQTFAEYLFTGARIELQSEAAMKYGKILTSFALIWLLLFLNFFSVRTFVARFQIAATASKILSTMTIVCLGMWHLIVKGDTHNLQDPFKGSNFYPGSIATSFFSGLFSYDGWDVLNFGAEEIENPRRTMSLAILIAMSLVAGLYFLVNLSFFVVLSVEEILSSDAVATTFSQHTMGDAQYIMPLLVSILLIGSLNTTLFSASRYLYAGAREGQMPSFISIVNKEHDSPRCALFYHVVMSMMFAFAGNTEELISYLGFAQWIQRTLTMSALIWIRLRNKPVHPDRIRTPLILPIAFMVICASLGMRRSFFFYVIFLWDKALLRFEGYRSACRTLNEKAAIYNQIVFNGVVDFEETQEGAAEEIAIETKRRETLASLTHRVAPLGSVCESEIKKQRF
ncbi:Y+L amino acid transporter 2 [Aphelenchoides fujianensis]|nr:Y+L amino acid transporter 2 [Aphelenchoides fujianensis]